MDLMKVGDIYFPSIERHFQSFGENVAEYQRPQRDYAFSFVKDWRRAIDLGANVGIFSRHFAEHFDEVWAIEPLMANVECLIRNVPPNVRIKKMAAGDTEREVQIFMTQKSLGGAFVCDHDEVEQPKVAKILKRLIERVPMRRLDTLGIEYVGLIKIDIQGSEVIALKGAAETIKRCKPVILIEEKPLGGPEGSTDHIHESSRLLVDLGMTRKERVGADRVYVFE